MKSDIKKNGSEYPSCFGQIDKVFPQADDGLRKTPETCFACINKTLCLKKAISGDQGFKLKEELVDRAYKAGKINFLQRWSRKKNLSYQKKENLDEIN
ncbi:MAG: hypothetical protein J7K30_11950 [Deltaproteobacteria bacterium]|nr:hypothetical protein [Deltaproteobacteria bacterium]